MTNEFKRTPTHGENDVDLRVATEPRRVTDAVLSQIIATKDGEIAALTDEVTHLAEKLAERDASVDRNSVRVELYRRALEIVAVGDAKQVQKHCEEALIEGGDWSAVPIALTESDDHEHCTFCGAPWGRYGCTCPKPTGTTKGA